MRALTELKKECMNRTFGVKSNWRILQYVISPLVNMTRFYRSHKNIKNSNNKLEDHSLLPCMHEDYIDATNGIIPERWFKAQKKNII